MKNALPPLLFRSQLRSHAWGSPSLLSPESSNADRIGENLLLIDDGDTQSVVDGGEFGGKTLGEMTAVYGPALVGRRHRTGPFPLLVRQLATGQRRPLVVHPDDLVSKQVGRPANSRMWYVIGADEGAHLHVGIRPRSTQQHVLSALTSPALEDYVHTFPAEIGDAYYVAAGRVHALGQGLLVLSVEQNASEPLTVSTWGNPDLGPPPEAEALKQALAAIHFQDRSMARIRGESNPPSRNRKTRLVNTCPSFSVDEIRLAQLLHDRTNDGSFHHITAIDGPIRITWDEQELHLPMGQGCLIPATLGYYALIPENGLTRVIRSALRI